jgi:hypothetical protein
MTALCAFVVPFISQSAVLPLGAYHQKMSARPSPFRSYRLPAITGGGGVVVTVTVAAELLTAPQEFDTRTQYVVVDAGETVMVGPVPPATGEVVVPDGPVYHWYDSGAVPVAPTESVAELPDAIVVDAGCDVIDGGVQAGGGGGGGVEFGAQTLPG